MYTGQIKCDLNIEIYQIRDEKMHQGSNRVQEKRTKSEI